MNIIDLRFDRLYPPRSRNYWLFCRCNFRFRGCRNVITLVHPAEIIIVVGTIFFGPHAPIAQGIAYLPKALLALVRKPVANREYCQISDNARGYAAAGGGIAVILSLMYYEQPG